MRGLCAGFVVLCAPASGQTRTGREFPVNTFTTGQQSDGVFAQRASSDLIFADGFE